MYSPGVVGVLDFSTHPAIDKARKLLDSVQPVKPGTDTMVTGLRHESCTVNWYATVMLRVVVASPKKFATAIDKEK